MTSVILKKGREESLLRFHPWVFSGAVADIRGTVAEGDLVQVCSAQGEPLALGHYQVEQFKARQQERYEESPWRLAIIRWVPSPCAC